MRGVHHVKNMAYWLKASELPAMRFEHNMTLISEKQHEWYALWLSQSHVLDLDLHSFSLVYTVCLCWDCVRLQYAKKLTHVKCRRADGPEIKGSVTNLPLSDSYRKVLF